MTGGSDAVLVRLKYPNSSNRRRVDHSGCLGGDADVVDELRTRARLGVRVDAGQAHDVGRLNRGDGDAAVGERDELAMLLLEAEVRADDVVSGGRADCEND